MGEEEAKKFKKDWVGNVFHSTYSSKQNGVLKWHTMLLQNKMFSEELTKDLKFFFEINMGSTDKVATVWEASKAYLRGKIIAYVTKV